MSQESVIARPSAIKIGTVACLRGPTRRRRRSSPRKGACSIVSYSRRWWSRAQRARSDQGETGSTTRRNEGLRFDMALGALEYPARARRGAAGQGLHEGGPEERGVFGLGSRLAREHEGVEGGGEG